VIRDILHRLRDRFPRKVLIWPVAVQGEKCAPEVAAAIRGFNALTPGGSVPRPDLIIVARGGGSLEDLWGFNEEVVVRAAADSAIPLISAVGHETDTTLIDHAADYRAPTPTAAAEKAVPVRLELLSWTADQGARLSRALTQRLDQRRQRLADLSRALGRPETLLDPARQGLDQWSDRLGPALHAAATRKRAGFNTVAGRLHPATLTGLIARERRHFTTFAERLAPALARLTRDAGRENTRRRTDLDTITQRLAAAQRQRIDALIERLAATDRIRQTLGYTETLKRGYAVIRAEGAVVTTKAAAETAAALDIEFYDGTLPVLAGNPTKPKRQKSDPPPDQGTLF
jgi:exodeoxyribonuclease VII large subunit